MALSFIIKAVAFSIAGVNQRVGEDEETPFVVVDCPHVVACLEVPIFPKKFDGDTLLFKANVSKPIIYFITTNIIIPEQTEFLLTYTGIETPKTLFI